MDLSSIADTWSAFRQAASDFFSGLAALDWPSLGLALGLFLVYLLLRSRASFNALRSAYPTADFPWRKIWGAYVSAYGLNGVVPAGSGNLVQLMLTRHSIPGATYPTVTAALTVGAIFDSFMCVTIAVWAFSQDVFPKPSQFADLSSFDIAYLGAHPAVAVAIALGLVALVVVGYRLLSARFAAFGEEVRQGLAILHQPRRYALGMCLPQFGGWCFRLAANWMLLQAFHIGGSLRNALLVLGVQVIAMVMPVTPGGAGVQQALLLAVFGPAQVDGDTLAAYSVGQQIAVVAFTLMLALLAVVFIFRFRGLRDVVRATRHEEGLGSPTLRERWAAWRREGPLRRRRVPAAEPPD